MREDVLKAGKVDTAAPEQDALHFQPQPLLPAGSALEPDAPARAKDPLPGQRVSFPVQEEGHAAGTGRTARRRSHLAVGGYLSPGNGADGAPDGGSALLRKVRSFLHTRMFRWLPRPAEGQDLPAPHCYCNGDKTGNQARPGCRAEPRSGGVFVIHSLCR